jgi:class 3 adenylate cyclase
LVASIFFARKITRPFEQLTDAIERLIKNDFSFNLSLSGFAGFTYLAKQFNLMLLKLQVSRNELVSTNKAFSRFVPHQILKLISQNGIKGISLGDCIEKEMTILFCDIRGFTRLSESMPPQENFKFINRYLKIMVPVINKHGGIIDKYMGDGIMALFPNSPDDALEAAVGMMQSLNKYNATLKAKNLPNLEIGLGLHSGNMMLGTVGTSSRMDVTVISDTVNTAARIESLTKTFNTPILISEELRVRLGEFDKRNLRFIATCFVQGKSQQMTLYEVFAQDPISLRNEKLANQTLMIEAWEAYKLGDLDKAISHYQKLMEKNPMDKALLALIEVAQKGRL